MPDAIDTAIIFRRTGKGDQEFKERAPTRRWLTLVMVDGRSSVADIEGRAEAIPTLMQELSALERDGCIFAVGRAGGGAAVSEVVSADQVESIDLDFAEEPAPAPSPAATPQQPAKPAAPAPRRAETISAAPERVAPQPRPAPVQAREGAGGASVGKLLRRAVLLLVVVAGLGIGALFVIPLDRYAPEIERIASNELGQPVSVRSVRLVPAPLPALELSGVSIGKTAEISAAKVLAMPTAGSWFSAQKQISRVELDGVTLTREALPLVAHLAKAKGSGLFRHVSVLALKLDLDKTEVGPFQAELEVGEGGGLAGGRLRAGKGAIDASIVVDRGSLRFDISAGAWETPGETPLKFNTVQATAVLGPTALAVGNFEARLLEGKAKGSAELSWESGWVLDTTLKIEGMALPEVLAVFSPEARWEGRLNGDLRLQARNAQFGDLLQSPGYEFAFRVEKAVMKGADVERALTEPRTPSRGGETRLDALSGVLTPNAGVYQYRQLRASSGLLDGGGSVDVGPDGAVRGRMGAVIRPKASLGQLPLYVGGSVREPVLSGSPLN